MTNTMPTSSGFAPPRGTDRRTVTIIDTGETVRSHGDATAMPSDRVVDQTRVETAHDRVLTVQPVPNVRPEIAVRGCVAADASTEIAVITPMTPPRLVLTRVAGPAEQRGNHHDVEKIGRRSSLALQSSNLFHAIPPNDPGGAAPAAPVLAPRLATLPAAAVAETKTKTRVEAKAKTRLDPSPTRALLVRRPTAKQVAYRARTTATASVSMASTANSGTPQIAKTSAELDIADSKAVARTGTQA